MLYEVITIHCGETDIYDIGIPSKAVFDIEIKTEALEERVVKSMLSIRPPDFHKGDAGRVYVVGGSPGMTGAPCLAGQAAMRMGAGLITVVVPRSLRPVVEARITSYNVCYTKLLRITSIIFPSTTGRRDRGTTTVISPAPIRIAACPARQGARNNFV